MRSRPAGVPSVWSRALWPAEDWLRRNYSRVTGALVVLLVANEVYGRGGDPRRWDWLFVSGYVTLLTCLRTALQLPERVHRALGRLAARRVLVDRRGDLRGFERAVHRSGRRAALWGGVLTPAGVLVAWAVAKGDALPAYALTAAGEAVVAVPVGMFLGRAGSYGRLGSRLRGERFAVDVDPEHLDGAGGLRPVGDLYFFQAVLLAVPAVFLGAWWFAIPLVGDYGDWRNVYVGLLVPVIACEVAGFLLPMRSFHVVMRDAKERLLLDADAISHEVAGLQDALRRTDDDADRDRIEARIARLTRRYVAIETMRTWPVDARIRRRFATGNLALFVPVVAQALGAPDSWQRLLEALQKAVTGQG
jgi:hypothetical protein